MVGALPVHGGGGSGRGGSCGVEVGHQPGRVGGEQEPRILEQVVQLASLAGVQREVSPCVTVPAQRVGGGVGRDDRLMGLGRVDQEVGVLLRVDQEVGERLVIHPKRAIRGRTIQELPGRARHLPDGGTGQRFLGKPASHQSELLSGEALVLGDGKRCQHGLQIPCPPRLIAGDLAVQEVLIYARKAARRQRQAAGRLLIRPGKRPGFDKRSGHVERVEEVAIGLAGYPVGQHGDRLFGALFRQPIADVAAHVVVVRGRVRDQIQLVRGGFEVRKD